MSGLNMNLCQIQDYVESLASKVRVNKFYPQTLSRKLGIPLELVAIELPKLIENGMLELKYEIRCSDDLNVIDEVDDYKEFLDKTLTCDICGEVEISYSNIYPVYYITGAYKEYLKKK